jgi:FixJ family two-component response regulator
MSPAAPQETPKVFIVDDDPGVGKALTRLFHSARLETVLYPSGEAFLAGIGPDDYGCILLDYHMHGADGREVLIALRQRHINLPVIILSAHDDPEIRQTVRRHGASAFFHKPVDDQALLDAIFWAIGLPSRHV